MNKKLLNLSGQVDGQIVDLLAAVNRVASPRKIPFFLVGAFARDLILTYCHRINSHRATADIDLAVEVSSWREYENLRTALLEQGFKETRQRQRLRSRDSLTVDLVPFGEIAHPGHTIVWPQDAIRMDCDGL